MNPYREMRDRQQERVSAVLHKYAFFAFSNEQFNEGLQKLGIDELKEGQLVRIIGGGFILKEHAQDLQGVFEANAEERAAALRDPDTGAEFAYYMFRTELADHEFSYTGDPWETLEALGYTGQEVLEDPVLHEAFTRAADELLHEDDE